MLETVLLCIAGALVLSLFIVICVWKIRSRRFNPTKDKDRQQSELNRDLENAGFVYDRHRDVFYSNINCWQREMGYCHLYDEGSSGFNMVMHCEPVTFSYGNKRWLIELWKGQYGITTGGEIGIYNTDKEDIETDGFTGTFYESAQNSEMMPMKFVLRKNGKVLFKCKAVHWWLTGFKLGEYSALDTLTMDAEIKFPNPSMRQAFINSLVGIGYQSHEFSVHKNKVTIHYTIPHTKQPLTRGSLQESIVQKTNEDNCRLYNQVTNKYKDTLDKLEYLKNIAPEVYELFIHSIYARGFYEAFSWLLDLIHDGPRPKPTPPKPCPPEPCPQKHCDNKCGSDSCSDNCNTNHSGCKHKEKEKNKCSGCQASSDTKCQESSSCDRR